MSDAIICYKSTYHRYNIIYTMSFANYAAQITLIKNKVSNVLLYLFCISIIMSLFNVWYVHAYASFTTYIETYFHGIDVTDLE